MNEQQFGLSFGEGIKHCGCRSEHAAAPGSFGGPSASAHYPPSLAIEPTHLSIDLTLNLKAESAKAKVRHVLVGRADGARSLELDAVGFLAPTVRDLKNRVLHQTYDGAKIKLTWDEPFKLMEQREIEISYGIEKPISGLFFMQPTAEDPNKPLYAATDHETERARYWLPCIDLPNVRTTLEFRLTAEKALTILANGKLESETPNADGTKTAVWRLDQRCPSYLVCFAVGDFERFDDGAADGVPLAYFASKDFSKDDLKRSFGRTKAMLDWMVKRLDLKFPFPKYYQFALPNFGGAMENISLVSWSDQYLLTTASEGEGAWLIDQVNVHEMAHSYFGDLVVCRDFAHAWLKESWATYMETCWLEDAKGEDEQLYDFWRNGQAYFSEADSSYARPIVTRKFASSWQMYDRHLYPGGAARLHTLRREMGDGPFWAGVQSYLKTYREQVVETDDFRRTLERQCGKSLQKFFDQWIYGAGYPNLKVSFSYDKEKARGTFEIEQKQVADNASATEFEFGTDLGWVIDGKFASEPVRVVRAKQSFTFSMAKEPEQVRFDPFAKVLHKLEFSPGDGKLKAQLAGAKDVIGRIHAAMALAESGKRANIKALLEAWRREPFWGVRSEIIGALGTAATGPAIEALTEIVGAEKDPMVLGKMFNTAASFRDERLATAVKARIERADLPPNAKASALRALGAQRDGAPIAALRSAAERRDEHHGVVQGAALAALGATRDKEAVSFLREMCARGRVPYRARRAAVFGISSAIPYLERPDRVRGEDTLIDLLRDEDQTVRLAAARGLINARSTRGIEPLEAFRRTLPLQERVVVEAGINSVTKGEDQKLAALEKRLDDLTAKWRKVQEQLENLDTK